MIRRHSYPLFAALAPILFLACSDEAVPEATPAAPPAIPPLGEIDCDPLVPSQCGFPFPSNVWTVADTSTPTGLRVAFGRATLPQLRAKPIDAALFADSDGFSAGQAPIADLPGATVTGLPTQDTIPESIAATTPTVLLDAETGETVPHFAEIDRTGTDDADRAFLIRPVVRLADARRYIVAIRHVVDAGGVALAPSPVFQALRDGSPSDDPTVLPRRALYDDIFARLATAGIARTDLQLAWDYTTASRENNTRWLLHMRDDALATVGEDGPEYVIDSIEPDPNEHLRLRILGRMTVPLYLDDPGPGGSLVFGEDGLPRQNGTAEYEFLVHVPISATTGTPRPLLQNGHGLLGKKTEGQNGYLARLANEKGYVAFGVDMVGMAEEDEETVKQAILTDPAILRSWIDRQHQGLLNSLLAMRMMKGRFWKDPAVQFDGKSAIDPTECYYRGDSQGGIFGATYMALTTDVTRGLLGEPGMPYNLLLHRSVDFAPFFLLLQVAYHSKRDQQIVLGLTQMFWDRTEPSGWVSGINADPLPGTPSHDVLLHVAIGDYQVTPLGAHIMARAVGAKNVGPVNRSIWGIDEDPGPLSGSGIVEFGFGLPEAPKTNTPPEGPEDDDPHDKVRELEAAFDMTDRFLKGGVIEATCDGPCDPE